MKTKLLSAVVMLSTFVLSFSLQCLADATSPRVKNKNIREEIPNITNEAEYAEFVRARAGQASSVKSSQPTKSSSSGAASSSRSKAQLE